MTALLSIYIFSDRHCWTPNCNFVQDIKISLDSGIQRFNLCCRMLHPRIIKASLLLTGPYNDFFDEGLLSIPSGKGSSIWQSKRLPYADREKKQVADHPPPTGISHRACKKKLLAGGVLEVQTNIVQAGSQLAAGLNPLAPPLDSGALCLRKSLGC